MQQKWHILGMYKHYFSAFQNDINVLGSLSARENEP